MKISLLVVSKTDISYIKEGIAEYCNRLKHYTDFSIVTVEVKVPSSASPDIVKRLEGEQLLKHIAKADRVVLLDEHGKLMRSVEFAEYLQKLSNASVRHLCFVVGGAFGFSDEVYKAAHDKLSLSPMTFNHQMVRLFFTEQLYRAFSILKGEKYHNE